MPAVPSDAQDAAAKETNARPATDLTTCDREPIHIPGSIQPHGLLLIILDAATMTVVAGAGDIEGRLSPTWLGRALHDVLGQSISAQGMPVQNVREALSALDDGHSASIGSVRGRREALDATAHRTQGTLFIELEPAPDQTSSAVGVLSALDAAGAGFERAADLRELCARAAVAFRQLIGFDRVMVYQFLDDDTGVVVAEDRDPALGSFMNHHFPASDIPKQARALYVRNRVRVIPDVSYVPSPIRAAADSDLPVFDLSDVSLRSVSPVHLQYLANMNVGASASISIVKDGVLWGLIACHHATPKHLPANVRMSCRALAGDLSRQIRAKDEAETYRERIRLRAAEDTVKSRLGHDGTMGDFFVDTGDDIRRMLSADGFAAVEGETVRTSGLCPEPDDIRYLASWARERAAVQPLATHELGARFAPARAYRDIASGLLAVSVTFEEPLLLLWFRAEQIETVNWAGNPHKEAGADPNAILTPRASFEAWSETVRGRAARWTLGEVEGAGRLAQGLLEARQNRRVRELNRELTAIVAEKESLLLQKDFLMKEVNHRVQNSLQLVSSFLRLQARGANDEALTAHLEEAQRRISAVGMVHRQLYSGSQIEIVDLGRYFEDLCADMCTSMGTEWSEHLALSMAPIPIQADRAVRLGLILTELVINAAKYAYDGRAGPISISLEQHRNRIRLVVADRGRGRTTPRTGFGTQMLDAMARNLDGTIEAGDNEPGLRMIVTAPIEDTRRTGG